MPTPLDDAAAILSVARSLQSQAAGLNDAVRLVRSDLDVARYDCLAARRQRERLSLIAGRVHEHGGVLDELAAVLLRRAAG